MEEIEEQVKDCIKLLDEDIAAAGTENFGRKQGYSIGERLFNEAIKQSGVAKKDLVYTDLFGELARKMDEFLTKAKFTSEAGFKTCLKLIKDFRKKLNPSKRLKQYLKDNNLEQDWAKTNTDLVQLENSKPAVGWITTTKTKTNDTSITNLYKHWIRDFLSWKHNIHQLPKGEKDLEPPKNPPTSLWDVSRTTMG